LCVLAKCKELLIIAENGYRLGLEKALSSLDIISQTIAKEWMTKLFVDNLGLLTLPLHQSD